MYTCMPEGGHHILFRWSWASMWLLEIVLRTYGRAHSALNYLAILPAQINTSSCCYIHLLFEKFLSIGLYTLGLAKWTLCFLPSHQFLLSQAIIFSTCYKIDENISLTVKLQPVSCIAHFLDECNILQLNRTQRFSDLLSTWRYSPTLNYKLMKMNKT